MSFFNKAYYLLQEWRFQFSLFIAAQQPILAKNFCQRYDEELKKSGFSNITAANPVFSALPGIYCICIQDVTKNILVGGGRLHLKMPQVQLPLERIDTLLTHQMKEYISFEGQRNLIAELSGFWIDRDHRRLHNTNIVDTIQIIICLVLGLGLQLGSKKNFCLSSRHIYPHAIKSGFRTHARCVEEGKIAYPPGQYSYFMDWDPLTVSNYVDHDILKLIYWARDNLSVNTTIITTATQKDVTLTS